ncbi:protein of unknown function [Mycolicibacterium novocastrense]|uniref:DUF222 domain-containing protein n=1 Tax=Mycolicibacterium novocastrense TaxID=59813 RepID=A0ABQ0KDY6_MYCNV|nr:protein of unknown function [Mycolicibacterium novocastrense]
MAGHANHYLAVFDDATGSALDLFRAKRIATPAQRIMLIARDGGCTKPCCTVGAYGCQVHHVEADWSKGGNTNVDELGLACGTDNRSVDDDGGWTTQMNERCEVEWLPPPGLDTGQARLNYYHRPERLLRPPEEHETHSQIVDTATSPEPDDGGRIDENDSAAPPEPDDDSRTDDTAASPDAADDSREVDHGTAASSEPDDGGRIDDTAASPEPDDGGRIDDTAAPSESADDSQTGETQSSAAPPIDGASEPGGPAPPGGRAA